MPNPQLPMSVLVKALRRLRKTPEGLGHRFLMANEFVPKGPAQRKLNTARRNELTQEGWWGDRPPVEDIQGNELIRIANGKFDPRLNPRSNRSDLVWEELAGDLDPEDLEALMEGGGMSSVYNDIYDHNLKLEHMTPRRRLEALILDGLLGDL